MRFATFAALAVIAIVGAGCSGCQALGPIASPAPYAGQTQLDERALGLAVTAANAADLAAEAAVDQGLLKGAEAGQVAGALEGAHQAIALAKAAYTLGDAAGYGAKLDAAKRLIDQAVSLIPAKP